MNYSPLIIISLKHTFYDSGNCPDFSVSANTETLRLLDNHRCVLKPNPYGLTVYVPIDEQQPLIPFSEQSRLFFDLNLQTDEFSLYSDLRVEPTSPNDIKLFQAGKLVEGNLSDSPRAKEPLLSMAIQRDFNQINKTPSTDEIRFFAKPVLWLYYVVADQSNSDKLAIVDMTSKTTWNRSKPLEEDSVYAQLVQQYPSRSIACFASEQTLVCQEICSEHLQLKQDDHVIYEQLPGPSYRNRVINAGSKSTEAIYEIVKYFTNSTT